MSRPLWSGWVCDCSLLKARVVCLGIVLVLTGWEYAGGFFLETDDGG